MDGGDDDDDDGLWNMDYGLWMMMMMMMMTGDYMNKNKMLTLRRKHLKRRNGSYDKLPAQQALKISASQWLGLWSCCRVEEEPCCRWLGASVYLAT